MLEVNKEYASQLNGQEFAFHDITVCIFYDLWYKKYWVHVKRPGNVTEMYLEYDRKIACFSFDDLNDAIEVCEYVLCKIALAEALFGWCCR